MDLIPAIDLLDGVAVRLAQGEYHRRVAELPDPEPAVRAWAAAGVGWLHLVDLSGARAGHPVHLELAERLAQVAREANASTRVELGGGIRTVDDARAAFGAGIDVVLLGTSALRDPQIVRELDSRWPGRVAVSLDLRDGRLVTDGWLRSVDDDPAAAAAALVALGAAHLVVTDVQRDGTKAGPNLDLLRRMRTAVPHARLVAAGGIASADDVRRLADAGVDGAIVGLALLDGSLPLHAALAAAGER